MPKIVISYRRSDSSAIAGRIFDRLIANYGEESVFMDVDHIPFGTDFRAHIQDVLLQTDVLLAVIGPNWLGRTAERMRIDEPADPVRVEIETAVARQTPIIPVLVDGAKMPGSAELPAQFGNFAYLNAAEVASGRDFRTHVERLISAIDRAAAASGEAGAGSVVRTVPSAARGAPAAPAAAAARRWLADGARYVVAPLVVLLVAHQIIVNVLDLNTAYLWAACTAMPLAFGFGLGWLDGRSVSAAGVLAVALGVVGTAAMTVSESLNSGAPLMPQNRIEWIDNVQFAAAIALGFFAGYLLACAVRPMMKAKITPTS